MIQFRVYLRGELGKLANLAEAECFLRHVSNQAIRQCRLPTSASDLATRLNSQEAVDKFVESLSDEDSNLLTKSCDIDWHENGVFEKLNKTRQWIEAEVPIDFIDVQQAEKHLRSLFERNHFRLTRLIKDPELAEHDPYKNSGVNQAVLFPVCMAMMRGRRYRLFDGIHRAIQMARYGKEAIPLVYAKE